MPLLTIKDLQSQNEDELAPFLQRAQSITDKYEEFIEQDGGDSHTRHPGIHASEISGCQRKVVYSLMATKRVEKSAPVWKKRFKVGHAIHKMLQDDFEKMARRSNFAITFEPEANVAPGLDQVKAAEWQIYSHCDGIFTIRDGWNGPAVARVLLEIKTASPGEYEKLKEPKPEHIEQAHVYMACLDVPMIWFLYYNKGNQNYTPANNPSFFVRFNQKKWEELEGRFEAAHTHVHLKTLPDRQESVGCEFCAFSWTCQPKYLVRRPGGHATHTRWSKP